ncbi:MAG TPA: hypothetical protein PKK51_02500 [Rhodocyclaceae bacterium]|nr:hypothetical protein [Rhodocyclaceae bacterium]
MQQEKSDEAACKLESHLVESSTQSDLRARFAATFLATLDYFTKPAGKLRWPEPEELRVLSALYEPGSFNISGIRSRCTACSHLSPCIVARALELCDHLGGSRPESPQA